MSTRLLKKYRKQGEETVNRSLNMSCSCTSTHSRQKSFLSMFKGLNMLITCIAILAVDFRVSYLYLRFSVEIYRFNYCYFRAIINYFRPTQITEIDFPAKIRKDRYFRNWCDGHWSGDLHRILRADICLCPRTHTYPCIKIKIITKSAPTLLHTAPCNMDGNL